MMVSCMAAVSPGLAGEETQGPAQSDERVELTGLSDYAKQRIAPANKESTAWNRSSCAVEPGC